MSNEQILREYPWLYTVNIPGEPERQLSVARVSLELFLEKPEGDSTRLESCTFYHFWDAAGQFLGGMTFEDVEKTVLHALLAFSDQDRKQVAFIGKEQWICVDGKMKEATCALFRRPKTQTINSLVQRHSVSLLEMLDRE